MPNIPELKIGNTTYKLKDTELRENIVLAQDTQPSNENNRIWINESQSTEYELPTYAEFSSLQSAVKATRDSVENNVFETRQNVILLGKHSIYSYIGETKGGGDAGYYVGEVFDVSNAVRVNIKATVGRYYNSYTFVDEDDNILSYKQENSAGAVDITVSVPLGATRLYVSTNHSNYLTVLVSGDVLIANARDKAFIGRTQKKIQFEKTNIGYIAETRSEDTPGYFTGVVFDVSDVDLLTISGATTSSYNNCTFVDSNENIISYKQNNNSTSFSLTNIVVPQKAKKAYVTVAHSNVNTVTGSGLVRNTVSVGENKKRLVGTIKYGRYIGTELITTDGNKSLAYALNNCRSITISAFIGKYYNIYTFLDSAGNVIDYEQKNGTSEIISRELEIPNGAVEVWVYASDSHTKEITCYAETKDMNYSAGKWQGKKIVWLGTSIPAGGQNGVTQLGGYPYIVGDILDADVYNEAVGSSPVHGVQVRRKSQSNPFGFDSNFERASRALSNTIEMAQWTIDNFNSGVFTDNVPSSLSADDKSFILSCSYENKIDKYFTLEKKPDLWVFDHGHNDVKTDESHYGESEYGGEFGKYTYRGAMNFLIDHIKKHDPHARIVIIGEYENQNRPQNAQYQTIVAEDWSFPLYKQWENLGFSQRTLETTGYWDDGYWVESGGPTQTITYLNLYLPDGTHPHTDKSGKTNRFMAEGIAAWLNGLQLD